jgi:hypothetical protein
LGRAEVVLGRTHGEEGIGPGKKGQAGRAGGGASWAAGEKNKERAELLAGLGWFSSFLFLSLFFFLSTQNYLNSNSDLNSKP